MRLGRGSGYLLGLSIVLVEKGLDPVSIVWMDSLQVLHLHEKADMRLGRP